MGKDELIVIVPAAGAGKRLGLGINKAYAERCTASGALSAYAGGNRSG